MFWTQIGNFIDLDPDPDESNFVDQYLLFYITTKYYVVRDWVLREKWKRRTVLSKRVNVPENIFLSKKNIWKRRKTKCTIYGPNGNGSILLARDLNLAPIMAYRYWLKNTRYLSIYDIRVIDNYCTIRIWYS